jgi:hypothetical protein
MKTKRISREYLKQADEVSRAVKNLEERMIAERNGDYKDFVLENNRRGIGGVE